MFPIEAGDINPENRIIPHLPGRLPARAPPPKAPPTPPKAPPPIGSGPAPHQARPIPARPRRFWIRPILAPCPLHRSLCPSPAPRWFVGGQRAAESRQGTLTEYCSALMGLPPKISRCPHLLDFFAVRPEDLKLPAADSQ